MQRVGCKIRTEPDTEWNIISHVDEFLKDSTRLFASKIFDRDI